MRRLMSRVATVAISLAVVFTSLAPAGAMQMPRPATVESNVVKVQESGARRYLQHRRWNNHADRRWDRRSDRRWDRREYRSGYYNGHRGYRSYRNGYRHHNGYWFPLGAFAAGAIIGGAINNQPRAVYSGNMSPSHVNWCENRYRSYRSSDNTYVPRAGTRAYCQSPYS